MSEFLSMQSDPAAERSVDFQFLKAVYRGDLSDVTKAVLNGADINALYDAAYLNGLEGLTALHIAVGHDNVPIVRFLIDRRATFGPDALGRWPSTIAALCEVGEELCDLVVEAEAASLEKHEPEQG